MLRPIRFVRQQVSSGSLGARILQLDVCPFDRYPDIYGIRASNTCRARHNNLRERELRRSMRVVVSAPTAPETPLARLRMARVRFLFGAPMPEPHTAGTPDLPHGRAAGDRASHDGCILADAEQERRLELPQERNADEVEPVHHRARAVRLDREAEVVEGVRPGQP